MRSTKILKILETSKNLQWQKYLNSLFFSIGAVQFVQECTMFTVWSIKSHFYSMCRDKDLLKVGKCNVISSMWRLNADLICCVLLLIYSCVVYFTVEKRGRKLKPLQATPGCWWCWRLLKGKHFLIKMLKYIPRNCA